MTRPTVVILAAGQGTRMRSATPKVLHDVCGRPMVAWTIAAATEAGAEKVVVVDGPARALDGRLPDGVAIAVQEDPRGTGDAVRAAAPQLDGAGTVIVLTGDAPLITGEVIAALAEAHAAGEAAATMATMELDVPEGYGRVVRGPDGSVERVVETKAPGDASPAELAIREVNTGLFAFERRALIEALERLEPDNAQGEYYLPGTIPLLHEAGRLVDAFPIEDPGVLMGVNDRVDLAAVRAVAQWRIHEHHMRAGVTIVDPASTLIDVGVRIGRDSVVEPASFLRGDTSIGEACRIGPLTTLVDSVLADRVAVPHSYLVDCEVASDASIGPFAYLRPAARIEDGAKVGTFVEVKGSRIAAGAKVPHLSYIGDADVGAGANLGAATITANYDGRAKHRTTIGRDVRTGVDTTLVAPVTVGDGAYTAAGSVITGDIPPGALGVARERQRNVEGYAERKRAQDDEPAA